MLEIEMPDFEKIDNIASVEFVKDYSLYAEVIDDLKEDWEKYVKTFKMIFIIADDLFPDNRLQADLTKITTVSEPWGYSLQIDTPINLVEKEFQDVIVEKKAELYHYNWIESREEKDLITLNMSIHIHNNGYNGESSYCGVRSRSDFNGIFFTLGEDGIKTLVEATKQLSEKYLLYRMEIRRYNKFKEIYEGL
jgi:hypothetical protein